MKIWLIPFNKKLKYISSAEESIARNLSINKANSYRFSRGYLRFCLSKVLNISPKDIPLYSLPGKPPKILGNYGKISMSHCKDALLVGFSSKGIGVDIENINRIINIERFLKSKIISEKERMQIKKLNIDSQSKELMKIWVLKEAAIKFSLGSVINDFKKWDLLNDNKIAKNSFLNLQINVMNKEIKNWSIGLATEEEIIDSSFLVEFLN